MQTKKYASNHSSFVPSTQLSDDVCKCLLKLWFQETSTCRTMLITTELAIIVG